MNNFLQELKTAGIDISFEYYGSNDLGTSCELTEIIDNKSFFESLFEDETDSSGIQTIDNYCFYLYARKLAQYKEVVSLLREEHRAFIEKLSIDAEEYIKSVPIKWVIAFWNTNIKDVFERDDLPIGIKRDTIRYMAQYQSGLKKETLAYLCEKHGYLLLDNYSEYEASFEKNPDLFERIFQTGKMDEIKVYRLEKVLDIFSHILNKDNVRLVEIVNNLVGKLNDEFMHTCDNANVENVIYIQSDIKKFTEFLVKTNNVAANDYVERNKTINNLLKQYVIDNGYAIDYDIPVGHALELWNKEKPGPIKLLTLTHHYPANDGKETIESNLNIGPETKKTFMDFATSNRNCDEFFTYSHQEKLDIMLNFNATLMTGLVMTEKYYAEYLGILTEVVRFITSKIDSNNEKLDEDIQQLDAHLQIVFSSECEPVAERALCYGTATYICALADKVLRVFLLDLSKGKAYIPFDKITMGQTLNEDCKVMVDALGKTHIKNLAYFFIQDGNKKIGHNYRNALAHWNMQSEDLSTILVAKLLWLFTDIINTIFLYYINKNAMEH